MPIAGLAVQSSLLRADGNGPSAIADLRGLDLRGALNQGHSRNPRQGLELPSLILLSMVPAEIEYEGDERDNAFSYWAWEPLTRKFVIFPTKRISRLPRQRMR
jgi:hypothetical protein